MINHMEDKTAAEQIDDIITMHGGWKGETLSRLRAIITAADPRIIEEIKWRMRSRPEGLPVWSHGGTLCFTEIWKDNIKLLFPKGAYLADPNHVFNTRLKSKDIRAIELREGDGINAPALHALVLQSIQRNADKAT